MTPRTKFGEVDIMQNNCNSNMFLLIIITSIIVILVCCNPFTASADESGFDYQVYDQHVIKTNLLLGVMYNNITYSQDANECFVWAYSEEKSHWHVLSVDNPQVISDYIEADDDGESRHLILGCFGQTTTPVWR